METESVVKKFKCEQCKEYSNIITWKDVNPNPGKLCDNCWKIYCRRMMQII